MAVFVSYARPDEPYAERVAQALRAKGYEVWRDDDLPAHRPYAEVIEERLKGAKAVVVLWSQEAAKSQWVRAEADYARSAATLVQATLDGAVPPMPFNQIQCADLSGWDGNGETPGWRKLAASVEALGGAPRSHDVPRAARSSCSVCVLPFQNMSGDAEQEYFSDGISEDITTDLSKVSALEVIARNTAFQFKNQSVNVGDIARQLGVSHVLEGSVRKAGNRVRITAQLIDGASGGHIWADRYDRDLTDIFAIQDEISKAIVDALKVKLLPEERSAIIERGTANAAAYDLYLMARQTWVTGIHGDTRREKTVLRLCDRIIDMEPGYGRAWGLKALAEATLFFGYNQGASDGVATADRALALDPSVIEAYCAKARASADRRNFGDAEEQIRKALSIDPNSWDANRGAAQIATWQRKFDDAARYYEKCAQLEPEHLYTWEMLTMVYRGLDDRERLTRCATELLKHASKAVQEEPSNCAAFGRGAGALVILGDIERAKEWIDRALLIDPDNLDIRYNFACSLINESAPADLIFKYLDYVFARSVGSIVRRADLDSDLDPIRDHPHFKEIYAAAMTRLAKIDAEQTASDASPPAAT
jgi:adenylate cyclase